jgi:spermidine synthase
MVDKLSKGWFSEISDEMWPGQCFSLAYDEILEDKKTDFQHIVILKT